MANPNLMNGHFMPNLAMPTYNAQPYFSESSSSSSQYNNNHTATTSGNVYRRENPKLSRPVPNVDSSESQEFKGTFIRVLIQSLISF